MTWRSAVSVVAFLVMYHQVRQIEIYAAFVSEFGGCGNPFREWMFNATLAGLTGTAFALRPLICAWREPGPSCALARIIHMTMIVGFAVFLLWFYAYPSLGISAIRLIW
jgi:hypothetical protein